MIESSPLGFVLPVSAGPSLDSATARLGKFDMGAGLQEVRQEILLFARNDVLQQGMGIKE